MTTVSIKIISFYYCRRVMIMVHSAQHVAALVCCLQVYMPLGGLLEGYYTIMSVISVKSQNM